MPEAAVGELVYWYPHGDAYQAPHAALVTAAGPANVCLAVLQPDRHMVLCKDGVRHLKDPQAKQPELLENGAWDLAPAGRERLELRRRVEALEKALADLKKAK